LHAITARDVVVKVECPRDLKLDVMTRSSVNHEDGAYTVKLGDIVAGSTRPVVIRVDIPSYRSGELLPFNVTVNWRGSLERQITGSESLETLLHVVPSHESDTQHTDLDVVDRVATLVEAVLAYRAMRRNERHDYEGASRLYAENRTYYQELVSELPDASDRLDRLIRSSVQVSRQWDGRSKRQAYSLAKKEMLAERDLRSKDQGDWHDHLDDQH
jgi:hypothetical protein